MPSDIIKINAKKQLLSLYRQVAVLVDPREEEQGDENGDDVDLYLTLAPPKVDMTGREESRDLFRCWLGSRVTE